MSKLGFLFVGLTLAACSDGAKEEAYMVVVEVRASDDSTSGLRFSVNGNAIGSAWVQEYDSLQAACDTFENSPIEVSCEEANGESCGSFAIDTVCCWAPNILSSPVVRGNYYVRFDGSGGATGEEGHCLAKDGTSTHVDGPGPDAGS